MGNCCGGESGHNDHRTARPSRTQNPQDQGCDMPRRRPQRTENTITPGIRSELLRRVDQAFGTIQYGVLGGTALAEYGNTRGTTDIDIIVPADVSDVFQDRILANGVVMTAGNNYGLVASDGRCYGVDISSDRDLSQRFSARSDSQRGQSGARLVSPWFLLNSKAHAWLTRVGSDEAVKRQNDSTDILFILNYIINHRIPKGGADTRWVVDYDFWIGFCNALPAAERLLQSLGLQRNPTPSASNRSSVTSFRRRRSSSAHSSR